MTTPQTPMYFKIIGNNLGNFPYHLGLNTLTENREKFNPAPYYGASGGLHYTTVAHILEYVGFGDRLCIVEIPEDAQVVEMENPDKYSPIRSFKCDKMNIIEMKDLKQVSTWEYLVSMGADVRANNDWSLHLACAEGRLEVAKYLVSMGANVHTANERAVIESSSYGMIDVVKYLVSLGADIHAENDSAIRMARKNSHPDIIEYLVSVGAE